MQYTYMFGLINYPKHQGHKGNMLRLLLIEEVDKGLSSPHSTGFPHEPGI